MNIKDMVKNKKVNFLYYRTEELWYKTECGFEFPVPISDVGTGVFYSEDKAILFMRWIRRHMEYVTEAAEAQRSHKCSPIEMRGENENRRG